MHALIVATREIADAGAFDLDHARAEIGELTGAKRRCNRVFERDDLDAVQRSHDPVPTQNERGSPSRCSATYERIRLVEIGAT